MVQDAGHPVGQKRQLATAACKGICDKENTDQRHAKSNGTAGSFKHHNDGDNAHPHVDVARENLVGDDVDIERHPSAGRNTQDDQRAINGPAQGATRLFTSKGGIDQETQHQHKAQVNGPLKKQAQRLHTGGVELKERERDPDDGDCTHHEPWLRRMDRACFGCCRH